MLLFSIILYSGYSIICIDLLLIYLPNFTDSSQNYKYNDANNYSCKSIEWVIWKDKMCVIQFTEKCVDQQSV